MKSVLYFIAIWLGLSAFPTTQALIELKESKQSIQTVKVDPLNTPKTDGVIDNFKIIIKENKKRKPDDKVIQEAYSSIRTTILNDVFDNIDPKEKEWYLNQLSQNAEISWKFFNNIILEKTKRRIFSKIANKLKPSDIKKILERSFIPVLRSKLKSDKNTDFSALPLEVINYIVGISNFEAGSRKVTLKLNNIKEISVSNWDDPKQLKDAYRYHLKYVIEAVQANLWEFNGLTEGFLQSREKLLDQNKTLKPDAIRIRQIDIKSMSSANTLGLWLVDINRKYLKSEKDDLNPSSEWKLKFVIKQHKNTADTSPKEEQAALRFLSAPSSPLRNMIPKVLIGRGSEPISYLPKISFEEKMLSVSTGNSQPQYVTVLKAAQGKDLLTLSALYDPKNTDVKPFQECGEGLSNFHQYFNFANMFGISNPTLEDISYTITHGDFHPQNVFHAEKKPDEKGKTDKKGQNTFIDIATMSISTQKEPLLEKGYWFQAQPVYHVRNNISRVTFLDDITKFIYGLVFGYDPSIVTKPKHPNQRPIPENPLLQQLAAFAISYIKTYPKDQQQDIWGIIKKEFNSKVPVIERYVRNSEEEPFTMCGKTEENMIRDCRKYLVVIQDLIEEGLAQP